MNPATSVSRLLRKTKTAKGTKETLITHLEIHMRNLQLRFRLVNQYMRMFQKSVKDDPLSKHDAEATEYLRQLDAPNVLEIGSRNVSGNIDRNKFPNAREYTGFDVLEGENVDIVGDVHELSNLVPNDHFDIVYSTSVFEHLVFPWKAALEINRVLKPGGYVLTQTHPAWPEHEMPWDFWRFPHQAFLSLFNEYTGFEIVSKAEGRPMRAFSCTNDGSMLKLYRRNLNGGVQCLARKIGPYRDDLLKWDLVASDVVNNIYPPKKT
ncbi:hypothetical protein GCM10011315_15430 [Roseovarius pacificus]|nr:hypothetical protein GCM10011315_15430 [Roseovarius pacificus]